MRQGCKYCQYNKYDGIYLGSNICSVYVAHINPYSEGYCEKFKALELNRVKDELNNELNELKETEND